MAREAAGLTGGTAALLAFIAEHERALTYDFRVRFHLPLSSIGGEVTYGEAILLISELKRETGSHLVMSLRGWDWSASNADIALITHAEWYMNVHRDTKASKEPIKLPRPWSEKDPNADVTAQERAELEQKLLARSALRDR